MNLRNDRKLLFITMTILATILFSQHKATTQDGRIVILKNDSTWEYEKSFAEKENELSFRKTFWGMNKKQVKQTETSKIMKDETGYLAYSENISGLEAFIFYYFVEDKLVRARYTFISEHSNKNDYLIDYDMIGDVLKEKYGKPKSDDTIWRDDLYKKDYPDWGFAISLGHLFKKAVWDTNSTNIDHVLYGENYSITHIAEYKSKALDYLEENEKNTKIKSAF